MTLIKWNDEFSVGIEEVDHEHREMIELINGLHDVMQVGADQVQVVELLGEIYAQISAHFALEEKMMRDTGYDGFADHKEDHDHLPHAESTETHNSTSVRVRPDPELRSRSGRSAPTEC